MKKVLLGFVAFMVSVSLWAQDFIEVALESGISHTFVVDLATFGGGAAVFDYNNDGFEDVYIAGGNVPDALYRNNGDGTFSNKFDNSGLESTLPVHTQGAAAADINRDGFKDLLVTVMYDIRTRELAPNLLFLNNGDGTFTDVTREFGLAGYLSNSMSASFGDVNADGYPDLFVANYFSASPNGVSIFNDQTITNSFAAAVDYLFINTSGRGFIEASQLYGMEHDGFGFEGTFTDFDNDQDLDLLIANDFGFKSTPNVALRNDFPEKRLKDRSNSLRLNFGMNAMGIAVGDYNFDGWMDYYVTNISESLFVENEGGTSFANVGAVNGMTRQLIQNEQYTGVPVSWGANFFDYDNDTDLDLFVANGALNPTTRPNHNFFFEKASAIYREVGVPKGLADPRIARGSVTFDYDNDGDMDLLVVNQAPREPTSSLPLARVLLYRNEAPTGNYLKVQLEGVQADLNGIGSRVEVMVDDRLLIREIDGGSSHQSQNSTIAHFGLGNADRVESVTVKWVGGNVQTITDVSANQLITIREEIDNSSSGEDQLMLSAFPSTFTSELFLEFENSGSSPVNLRIFDLSGRLVETLISDHEAPRGIWRWNADPALASGVYVVQLSNDSSTTSKKVFKVK